MQPLGASDQLLIGGRDSAKVYAMQPQAVPPPTTQQQSFAREVPLPPSEHPAYEVVMRLLGAVMGGLGSVPCLPFCCWNPYRIVPQGNVGLLSRFGKFYRSVDPGLYFVNVCSEDLRSVDIKIQIEDVPRQQIMTKDNVSVDLDSVLYWHAVDPYIATYLVQDVRRALIERTMTTMRMILGARTLQDSIEHRESIANEIQAIISPAAQSWGVKIESILIKDLQFTRELQESLSAAAKQKRIGESKVIAAQAEVDAAKLMREASDILNTPAAMQIRYLETLLAMAKTAESKVIFMPPSESGTISKGKGAMTAKEAALLDSM